MKYCFNYTKRSEILHLLDEVNVKFDPEDTDVLFEYMVEHKHQRVNAKVSNMNHIFDYHLLEKFENFKDEHKEIDFAIILPKYDLNIAQLCEQKELKFFFDTVVRDWETFNLFLSCGVSDIYLVEQMMFEIKEASAAAHKKGVKIRTFPNIAQRKYEETQAIKCFFIRPEDIDLYEGLVDVMDLYTVEEINQDVIYEAYAEDKMWWGPLKEIIIGLDDNIDGKYIIPRFGERRLDCGRKCFKGKNCEICDTINQLSHNLAQAGLLIQYDKIKKEEQENGKRSTSKNSSNE